MNTQERNEELSKIQTYLNARFGQGSSTANGLLEILKDMYVSMSTDVIHFVFEKSDGTIREAYGTRAHDIISRYCKEPGNKPKSNKAFNGTFAFFDIDKREWRCFKVERLVMIKTDYVI